MQFHLADQRCDVLENICNIRCLDFALYGHLNVVLKKGFCRHSMRTMTGVQETSSAFKRLQMQKEEEGEEL